MSAMFTNSAYLLSGVSAYAFLTHIQVGMRKPAEIKHILFALMCLCICAGAPFNAITNSAVSVPQYIFGSKVGYTFIILFILFMTWFIPCCTGKRPVYALVASNLYFVSVLILNLIMPYGFQYDYISGLKLIQLPWGESYTVAVGTISLIYKISVLVFLLLMSYLIVSLIKLVRSVPTSNNKAFLMATLFLVLTYIEAILVRTGAINFLPLGTFGGLGLIIVMSIALSKEHNDAVANITTAIAKEHKKLDTILKTASDGIYILDKNGLLVLANEAFLNMHKLDKSAINQLTLNDWNVTLETTDLRQQLNNVLVGNQTIMIETKHRTSDGHMLDVEVSINALDIDGERFLFCASRDITERKILQRQLEQQARIDYLTKVSNRGYFMLQAEQELTRSQRYGSKLSLLMLDIDNFKRINDTYGHKSGDIVLQKLIEVCRNTMRLADIIGRVGGEEFAILLPETDQHQAHEVAERLREHIAAEAVEILNGTSIHFTVSIGVSMLDHDCNLIDTLLSNADEALYKAKNAGRNQVMVYSA